MEKFISVLWLRRSRTFWAGIIFVLVALFSSSMPTAAVAKSSPARQASVQRHKVTRTVSRTPAKRRWIEVNLSKQRLIAWEGNKRVYSSLISSGKRTTPTRTGTFNIQSKHRVTRMQGRDYNVPDVPYAMYYSGGYALHGAYWNNNFGTRASHGCVNLPVQSARQLFKWASVGTKVVVHS